MNLLDIKGPIAFLNEIGILMIGSHNTQVLCLLSDTSLQTIHSAVILMIIII